MRVLSGFMILGVAIYLLVSWINSASDDVTDVARINFLEPPAATGAQEPFKVAPAGPPPSARLSAASAGGGRDDVNDEDALGHGGPSAVSGSSGLAELREQRVRAIQSGLRRADCYSGAVDGNWSAKTQRSMQDFLAAVNAALPTQRPDEVLQSLIETHRDTHCEAGRKSRIEEAAAQEARRRRASERERRERLQARSSGPRLTNPRPSFFDQVFGGG